MIKRLKIKFVCINMLIVTVMLTVIFGMVLHFTGRNVEEQSKRVLQSVQNGPGPKDHMMRERRIPYFIVTVTPQGEFTVTADAYFGHSDETQLLEIARSVHEKKENQGILKEHNLRFSRKILPVGEKLVFLDISVERGMMEELVNTCIFIGIVSYVLFFLVSILLAQWAIRPVETAWERQHQFVADASHELKTPLTVIMTNAELLQDKGYEESSRDQFAKSILTMSRQMRGLVEGLLDLARVDNGIVKKTFSDLDFSALLNCCILPFEPMFFENGMGLETHLEPDLFLRGSEPHLRQVVEILLDNAIKYGQTDKPVTISLHRQGRSAKLCVSSSGDEIAHQDLKNIFKRFYRIDKARSMNNSYGLGLSIAESIVAEHHGKIWAESKNGMNSFCVQLPCVLHSIEVS